VWRAAIWQIPAQVVESLPRLAQVAPDDRDIRCTVWAGDRGVTRLLLSLSREPRALSVDGQPITLVPDTCTSQRLSREPAALEHAHSPR
jgi:hypothetical protein